tara:strand:- start:135 stop:1007 length:873 start_codon:yes stop_codon:yes gene_type:complete
MKIFDCTTYFEEDLMMDIRFNILDPYVDKFVVCEANYSHSGNNKKINFDINNFKKFKDKIIHVVVESQPEGIKEGNDNTTLRMNSIKRIEHQRNHIHKGLSLANDEDLIMYSDNDEIPNLSKINFRKSNSRMFVFKQKIFYYKLNLLYDRLNWFGTKCCKLKNLKEIKILREVKPKKFKFYRIDTLFSNLKFINLQIIDEGGWHFTNLKKPDQLLNKYLNDEMHSEFLERNITVKEIERLVSEKKINYDHFADSKSSKKQFNEFELKKIDISLLPVYIQENIKKYEDWII